MNSFVKRVLQILVREFFIKHIPLSFKLQFSTIIIKRNTSYISLYFKDFSKLYEKACAASSKLASHSHFYMAQYLKDLEFVSSLSCFLYSFRIIPEKLTSDNISVRNQLLKRWHLKRIWQIPTSNFSLYQCLECCFFKSRATLE